MKAKAKANRKLSESEELALYLEQTEKSKPKRLAMVQGRFLRREIERREANGHFRGGIKLERLNKWIHQNIYAAHRGVFRLGEDRIIVFGNECSCFPFMQLFVNASIKRFFGSHA